MKRTVPGLNIQHPWSDLIAIGKKTIETRSYPLPKKFENVELAIIETPGRLGKKLGIKKARIVGTVIFSGCIQYKTKKHWLKDQSRHLINSADLQYAFSNKKPKWGWFIARTKKFEDTVAAPSRRGIIYASSCAIPGS